MANTYTQLIYHIVFSTKNRIPWLAPEYMNNLYSYMAGILRNDIGKPLVIGGMPDHVHLVTKVKPSISISEVVKIVKAKSSGWVNDSGKLPERFSWQTGYAAFTSTPFQLDDLMEYVRIQDQHHKTRTFQEEYLKLLNDHGVDYDPRYVFD